MSESKEKANNVTATMMIPDLLQVYPQVRPVLDRYGLHGCGGPHGPAETVEYFARAHGVDTELLVVEINQAIRQVQQSPDSVQEPTRTYMDELGDPIYRRFFKAGIVVIMTCPS